MRNAPTDGRMPDRDDGLQKFTGSTGGKSPNRGSGIRCGSLTIHPLSLLVLRARRATGGYAAETRGDDVRGTNHQVTLREIAVGGRLSDARIKLTVFGVSDSVLIGRVLLRRTMTMAHKERHQ